MGTAARLPGARRIHPQVAKGVASLSAEDARVSHVIAVGATFRAGSGARAQPWWPLTLGCSLALAFWRLCMAARVPGCARVPPFCTRLPQPRSCSAHAVATPGEHRRGDGVPHPARHGRQHARRGAVEREKGGRAWPGGRDDWTPLTPFPRFNAQNLATALHYASGSGGVDHAAIVKARGACEPPQNTCEGT